MARVVAILDDYQHVALRSADWSRLQPDFEFDVVHEHIGDPDALVDRIGSAEVVVAMRERTAFPAELLRRLPHVRLLVTTGMANASIDLAAARELGITVCGTGGAGNAVPELTLGMMIALTRGIAVEDAGVRRGDWQQTIGPGLAGRTLGVVGLGRLGAEVAHLATAFRMNVVAWSPHLTAQRAAEHGARAVEKEELFVRSDIVTVHVPLVDSTRGLVGADELEQLGPNGYLVNTSRGPIVDERALVSALADRRIAGAALDVYDVEPLPAGHPFLSMPRTLLLPHIGYVTTDAYQVFYEHAVDDVLAWTAGSPIRELS